MFSRCRFISSVLARSQMWPTATPASGNMAETRWQYPYLWSSGTRGRVPRSARTRAGMPFYPILLASSWKHKQTLARSMPSGRADATRVLKS
ncbi:MAG: hypothetical protein OXC26_02970 [Albidovulum sp.]|nr:hypothetical protein [Albidovulum sp.]